jgi:hypothetical protein
LKRQNAKKKAEGKADVKGKGKKPMEFALFCSIGRLMWQNGSRKTFFNLLFMLLAWNLMSRSKNVTNICLTHFDWRDDALTILFCQTKTDQGGDRAHPRHVYANPFKPEICPILGLGVFFLLTEWKEGDVALFGGGHQYSHFSKGFKALIKASFDQLRQWISDIIEWGTHSFRKGSATFCCSGSTAGAHISAVSNRAGWKQPGVQDTYLVFSDAGDQVVGRIAAGLPLDCAEFAILPPMFRNPNAECVKECLRLCFPTLISKVPERVLLFCLASIVYHRSWLRATVPAESPLWNTSLFKNPELLSKLVTDVECRLPQPSDDVRVTGLPPHISLLREFKDVRKDLKECACSINAVGDRVTRDVLEGLDNRQIESHVTPSNLSLHITEAFSKLGFDKLIARLSDEVVQPVAIVEEQTLPIRTYMWGGKLGRLLPETFKLPASGPRDMWQLFVAGNPAQGVRPLRLVSGEHVCNKNAKKRFSDFKTLMGMVEQKVRDEGRWSDAETIVNAEEMFEIGKVAIQLPPRSQKNYSRRNGNLVWTSVLKVLREEKRVARIRPAHRQKRGRQESEDDDEDEEEELEESDQPAQRESQSVKRAPLAPPRKQQAQEK